MKTRIIIFFLLFFSISISAQRYYGIKPVEGYLVTSSNSVGLSFGIEKFISLNKNSYFVEISPTIERKKLRTQDFKATILNLNANVGYNRYFDISDNYFPFLGVGVILGYDEFLNKNKLPESVILERKFGVQYGAFANFGFEYMFEKVGLNVVVRPTYNLKNSNLNTFILIGFKYYM